MNIYRNEGEMQQLGHRLSLKGKEMFRFVVATIHPFFSEIYNKDLYNVLTCREGCTLHT